VNHSYNTLRLILGDQLNQQHSWFSEKDESVLYVIAELHQETNYVKHHVQKICAFFAAMAAFAEELQDASHHVLHLTLDDTEGYRSLDDMIVALAEQYNVRCFEYQQPDEYRLDQQLSALTISNTQVLKVDSEHFIIPFDRLNKYFKPRQSHKMEMFYRKVRREEDVLMENSEPVGGQWNFDKDNRNKLKAKDLVEVPEPKIFHHDMSTIIARLKQHKVDTIGRETNHILWPITRTESLELLSFFCTTLLPRYGTFQDAMTCQSENKWSLYHSRLSFSLNTKMLSPREVIDAAISEFESRDDISLSQVEGFVRQILGWREFVRGIYWLNMPDYRTLNYLEANRPLPEYFWTGETKMKCMSEAIQQSLDYGFAHHIQRLMITGTFSLLTGIHPDAVDDWYLGIYLDAIEWVELPNTRGMSQFADGGLVATKPYSASGNYINKMSDYCKNCSYSVTKKTGADACPFNSLYWHFMIRHRDKFEKNPRIGMVYRNWDKQAESDRSLTLEKAEWCLVNLNEL
jgi:deoxyribodipyrimidine photolyase-related protein